MYEGSYINFINGGEVMRDLIHFTRHSRNPFSFMEEFQREMNEILSPYRESFGNELVDGRISRRTRFPNVDFKDREGHFLLSLDVPGVSKEDIQIEIKNNQLLFNAEHSSEDGESHEYRHYQQVINLPQGVDQKNVQAHYENGILNIALPKTEQATTKKIEVTENKKEGIWSRLLGQGSSNGKKEGQTPQ